MGDNRCSFDKIMAYEQGEMDEEECLDFFQGLIDTGLVWRLQGSYGRTAASLINAGYCTVPEKKELS